MMTRLAWLWAFALFACGATDTLPPGDVPAGTSGSDGQVIVASGDPVEYPDALPPSSPPTGGTAAPPFGTAGTGGTPVPGMPPTADPVFFTEMELALARTLSPLPEVPPDPTNAFADDPSAVAMGQKLFFDASYSGPLKVASDLGSVGDAGKVSCWSCHSGAYMDDDRSQPRTVSTGTDVHTRNSPTVINSAFQRWTNWGGRFSAQWELPLAASENGAIMNATRLAIAHRIFDAYRADYEAIFGAIEPAIGSDAGRFPAAGKPKPAPTAADPNPPDGAWEGMTDADREIVNRIFVNFGKTIAAYLRTLVSRNAPFDRFLTQDVPDAIGEDAKLGLRLFVGRARCINCHSGPLFSDGAFHRMGVAQTGELVPPSDDGRFKDIPPLLASPFSSATAYSDDTTTGRLTGLTNPPPEETRGQFRTPSLRGVALTPPYMHAGQLQTLEEVIEFYDVGGGVPLGDGTYMNDSMPPQGERDPLLLPLHMTPEEKADLRAFLETLTGEGVPGMLVEDPWAL